VLYIIGWYWYPTVEKDTATEKKIREGSINVF
jgi:hypothetical protein